jgi:penicillin-binding protein 2
VVFHNVEPGVNALMNLREALKTSCDTWFYRLGVALYHRQQLGQLDLQRWALRLGLGHQTGLDIGGEAAGVVPTPAWLRKTFTAPWARVWYEGTSVNLSIGQGYLAVSPLQLAVAYSALANGGAIVRPHVGGAVVGASGRVLRRLPFPPVRRVRLIDAPVIRNALIAAAHEPGGTSAPVFASFPVPVAGKTGTAQVPGGSDDSWYASWAPASRPRVVVVVLIDHGGFGVEAAAPAARDIYSAFFGLGRHRGRG